MKIQTKCPICKSTSINIVFKDEIIGNGNNVFQNTPINFYTPIVKDNPIVKKLVGRTYHLEVKQCLECDHLFQSRIFSKQEELEYHKSFFKDNGVKNGYVVDYFESAETIIKELKFIYSFNDFKTILDVGSSTGEFCFIAKALNFEPSSIDPCINSNNILEKNYIDCFESVDSINKTFDVIRVSHVLSHIHNDIERFIGSLIPLLKRNGIIYFIDHVYKGDISIVKNPLLHVNLFSHKSFFNLLSRFKQIEYQPYIDIVYNNEDYLFKQYRRI